MKTSLRFLAGIMLAISAATFCAPEVSADVYDTQHYSTVSSYIRRGENAMSNAKSARRQAESYQRDYSRAMNQVDYYNRRNDYSRARDYMRQADRAMERVREYINRANRYDADAASYFRRAAAELDNYR